MGDVSARFLLGCAEAESENVKLALRHWKLAATAGDKHSVKILWKFFSSGELEKPELEETLRAHKEACDAMSSEDRERYKLFEKTREAGTDTALLAVLEYYYSGLINAKQLNKGLALYRKQGGITSNQMQEILKQK
jgi:hypothetical protein